MFVTWVVAPIADTSCDCSSGAITAASCDSDEEPTPGAKLNASCCCEVDVAAEQPSPDPLALNGPPDDFVPEKPIASAPIGAPPEGPEPAVPENARPPPRTLLSLHTLLLC